MPRGPRRAPGGLVYHVLNRAVARWTLFEDEGDYAAFERILAEAVERHGTRLLSYCLMPNHWHLVLWPSQDGELSALMRWLSTTHVRRWHQHHHTFGQGHIYQGRFKSFPVQSDQHLRTVCRYVERNPLRAKLVERAEQWRWSSLWRRERGQGQEQPILSPWPVERAADWLAWVNEPQTPAELEALRASAQRGRPFGETSWQQHVARELGLEFTFRQRGPVPRANGAVAGQPAAQQPG